VTTKGIKVQDDAAMKAMLHRIVAMLTRMAMKFDGVAESSAAYDAVIDYDYEHRFAEHEHDQFTARTCNYAADFARPLDVFYHHA